MRVTVIIPAGPGREEATYHLTCDPEARVMEVLHAIHEEHEPGLAYRPNFCKRGSCGLCMVQVNGKAVKACTAPVRSLMRIEPLPRPVIRDLAVAMDAFPVDRPRDGDASQEAGPDPANT